MEKSVIESIGSNEIKSLSQDATLTCKSCGKVIYPINYDFADDNNFYRHDEWSIDRAYNHHMKKCIESYIAQLPPLPE